MRYSMPAASLEDPRVVTLDVRKSRFIGWCVGISDSDDAERLIAHARQSEPSASHHCWAYIAGPPGETRAIGFADDGEPGGTAGRPMYQVLEGSGLGHIACVVSRHFGGIKLGTGGLARAYAGTVSNLVADLPTRQCVPRRCVSLDLTFADEQPARAWLAQHEGLIVQAQYHGEGVTLEVAWPQDAEAELAALDTLLHGRLGHRFDDE